MSKHDKWKDLKPKHKNRSVSPVYRVISQAVSNKKRNLKKFAVSTIDEADIEDLVQERDDELMETKSQMFHPKR